VVENNRDASSAIAVARTLENPRLPPLLELLLPDLLGGEAEGEQRPWTDADRWVLKHRQASTTLAGLPWVFVTGGRSRARAAPAHEPRELARALLLLLEKPSAGLDDLERVLPGPDLGAGVVADAAAVRALYETGEGALRLRATIALELPSKLL